MTAATTLIFAVIAAASPVADSAGVTTALVPVDVLVSELERASTALKSRDAAPHYIAVAVEDREEVSMVGAGGTLFRDDAERDRWLDVDLRVGTPQIDSTHELRGTSGFARRRGTSGYLPLDSGPGAEFAIRRTVWRAVDTAYRDAAEAIVRVRSNLDVKVKEEDPADDFEPRPGEAASGTVLPPAMDLDHDQWSRRLRELSLVLDRPPWVEYGQVALTGARVVKTFIDSEGARVIHGITHWRVSLHVRTTAKDGDNVAVDRTWEAYETQGLPDEASLRRACDDAVARLDAMRTAPRGSPYSGPVLLRGRAAGVFFHEVLGHRAEGHRLKRDDEGKTFAEYVGKRILPDWIDVYDDPNVTRVADTDLLGRYDYDDEGVKAERATLVKAGVLKGFLMGRSPVPGFVRSNGHGRRGPGEAPKSRMGSLIIEAGEGHADLRAKLIEQIREDKLEYGLIVEEIGGGFTSTGRVEPNAFNVRADASWKVWADGRPDELIRGIDLVGTPLTAFNSIVAAGRTPEVFNGACGAESGWVPVSAVSPAILLRRLELQLKEKASSRPPLLPKPRPGGAAGEQS